MSREGAFSENAYILRVGHRSLPAAAPRGTLPRTYTVSRPRNGGRGRTKGVAPMTSTTITIPLFPLDLVLFPGVELPLHIFEERYKRMVSLCLRENRDFGVVLAKAAGDAPGQVLTYHVGTTAHIRGATRFADGRLNLATQGQRRFHIVSFHWEREYMTGEVAWLPDDDGASIALRDRAEVRWNALRRRIADLTEQEIPEAELSLDPAEAAYTLAASLPVANVEKQSLLEATDTEARLREAIRLINREDGILRYTSEPQPGVPQPPEGSVISPN